MQAQESGWVFNGFRQFGNPQGRRIGCNYRGWLQMRVKAFEQVLFDAEFFKNRLNDQITVRKGGKLCRAR